MIGYTLGAMHVYDANVTHKDVGGSIWTDKAQCYAAYDRCGGMVRMSDTDELAPMGIYEVEYDYSCLGQDNGLSHFYLIKMALIMGRIHPER